MYLFLFVLGLRCESVGFSSWLLLWMGLGVQAQQLLCAAWGHVGFSCGSTTGSVAAHGPRVCGLISCGAGLSCMASVIFPVQRSKPCPLYWQAGSYCATRELFPVVMNHLLLDFQSLFIASHTVLLLEHLVRDITRMSVWWLRGRW